MESKSARGLGRRRQKQRASKDVQNNDQNNSGSYDKTVERYLDMESVAEGKDPDDSEDAEQSTQLERDFIKGSDESDSESDEGSHARRAGIPAHFKIKTSSFHSRRLSTSTLRHVNSRVATDQLISYGCQRTTTGTQQTNYLPLPKTRDSSERPTGAGRSHLERRTPSHRSVRMIFDLDLDLLFFSIY